MMECTMQNKKRILLRRLLSVLLLLGLWQLATFYFSPMVVPPIPKVAVKLVEIIVKENFLTLISTTLLRLGAGLVIGIVIGVLLGLLFGLSKAAEDILSPFVGVLQAVPPVCWVVLALVWFGFNGKPCVFIVVTATIPTIAINLSSGVRSIDPALLEMARLYRFSKAKTLRHIILPSVDPYFRSALEIVIGGSWKLVVMGEVLTTSSGIGGAVNTARLNLETEAIIAWAFLLVVFCFLTQMLLKLVFCRKGARPC